MSQKDKIEQLLSDGREHTNRELNEICFRYGARIKELREELKEDGYEIIPEQITKGLWTYRLQEIEAQQEFDLEYKYPVI